MWIQLENGHCFNMASASALQVLSYKDEHALILGFPAFGAENSLMHIDLYKGTEAHCTAIQAVVIHQLIMGRPYYHIKDAIEKITSFN